MFEPPATDLAADLRARSDEQLEALLRARPDLAQPVPADLSRLATRATLPQAVVPALHRLDRLALAVLDSMTTLPAPVTVADVVDAVGPDSPAALQWLRDLVLVWGPDDDLVVNPGVAVVLPRTARGSRMLLGLRAPTVQPVKVPRLDHAAAGAGAEAVRRVEQLLESWTQTPPPMLRSGGGGLGVRELRRTAADLGVAEPVAALLVEVAYAAGLLNTASDFRWLPTPAYDTWLRTDPAARWVALAEAWLAMARSSTVGGTAARTLSADRHWPPILGLRRATLEVLAELPKGSGADADTVAALLAWRRPLQDTDAAVRATLAEAAVLGVTAGGALPAYARLLLDGQAGEASKALDRLLPDPIDHVLIQTDLTAVAPGPLEPDLARELALVADVESTGGATVYRFTDASLRRAYDAGRTAADLHALLRQRSRTPVPQALTYLIDDVGRRHGKVRVGGVASYIRCDDPATLDRICSAREAGGLRLRRLAPTVVVSAADPADVLDVLRLLGVAPAEEGAGGAVLVHADDARRARPQPRQRQRRNERPLSDPDVRAAVAALRHGERAHADRQRLHSTDSLGTLTALRAAAAGGRPLLIGYVNAQGMATQRLVWPQQVEGGYVTAYDSRHEEVRTFALHRITGIGDPDSTLEG